MRVSKVFKILLWVLFIVVFSDMFVVLVSLFFNLRSSCLVVFLLIFGILIRWLSFCCVMVVVKLLIDRLESIESVV